MKLSLDSKVNDIFAHPLGHDIILKLLMQLGLPKTLITNPIVRNLKLSALSTLTKNTLGPDFFTSILTLLNQEQDLPPNGSGLLKETWWKEAIFYQIYPRSFMDSNNDGIGDLRGILSKLDYLKDLGIDALWLSPIYDSPLDDNGYDIRNYYQVLHEFGSMDDFDILLQELHRRDMKLIMDLVINHTSDEHPWFQEALSSKDSPFHDFYLWKEGSKDILPNNWTSFFSGPAWNYYEELGEWGLHLFSKKQMDLNWENQSMRNEIYKMVRFWLEKGVDGFRLDVINYISKTPGLPMGNTIIGNLMEYTGVEHYFCEPKLHTHLHELRKKTFEPFDAFSVGETPGIGMECAKLLTSESREELDMIFSFDHLETPGHVRFDHYLYDLNFLKKHIIDWTKHYGNECWQSLFYDNHDNPRMLSKALPDPIYRDRLAKLLAIIQLTTKGTPFLFQGQEIGCINKEFESIHDIKDVESINLYQELLKTKSPEDAFQKILSGTRDHARVPMQWDSSPNAGFSQVSPWISNDNDYLSYNVEDQLTNASSILSFYKELIAFRKVNRELIYGETEYIEPKRKDYFGYKRFSKKHCFVIEMNIGISKIQRPIKYDFDLCEFSNYESDQKEESYLLPFEANLYRIH